MTPLARHLTEVVMGARWRSSRDAARLTDLSGLSSPNCRCFEASAVAPLVDALVGYSQFFPSEDRQVFLPAPITWIEARDVSGRRHGWLIQKVSEQGKDVYKLRTILDSDGTGRPAALRFDPEIMFIYSKIGEQRAYKMVALSETSFQPLTPTSPDWPIACSRAVQLAAFLSLINTPDIFKQSLLPSDARLEKHLHRAGALTAGQRLQRAIVLKMQVDTSSVGLSGVLTGDKAYHFCRAHLRFKRGKVEFVRGHWRGNLEKGIVSSDYRVQP